MVNVWLSAVNYRAGIQYANLSCTTEQLLQVEEVKS